MYRVKIKEVKGTSNPYEIIYRRYDTDKPIRLPTGQVIQNDVLKGLTYLYNDIGIATHPQEGDEVLVMPINATEYIGFCVDWQSKPSRAINELCLGNFKTSNFLRINNNSIKAEESGTNYITFISLIKHLVQSALVEIISSGTAKLESLGDLTLESTGGKTSVKASSDIDLITSSNVNLGNTGGVGVARIGDTVDLVPASPTYGQIITGSSNVKSI